MERVIFTKDGADLLDGIAIRNGRANPFGWSTHEVWHMEHCGEDVVDFHIGDLYCGFPTMKSGYGFRIESDEGVA